MQLTRRQIARSLSVSRDSVAMTLARAQAVGPDWAKSEGLTEAELERLLYRKTEPAAPTTPTTGPAPECLTPAQRSAIAGVYAPTVADDGTVIHPGWSFGGEGEAEGWQNWITGTSDYLLKHTGGRYASGHSFFGAELYKYFVFADPDWDYATYDVAGWREDTRHAAALLDATDPDLRTFAAGGSRLIVWHGWSDPGLSALSTIDYVDRVKAHDPSSADYLRLFLLPGVLHCGGGPGPDHVDWLGAIVDWVENGVAPDRLIATKSDADGAVVRTRPLCPYPQRAVYAGSGSTDEAEHFVCRMP